MKTRTTKRPTTASTFRLKRRRKATRGGRRGRMVSSSTNTAGADRVMSLIGRVARRARRGPLSDPDTWVNHCVEHVHEQVGSGIRDRDDDRQSHDDRVVTREKRLHAQLTDPGNAK